MWSQRDKLAPKAKLIEDYLRGTFSKHLDPLW